jgi:hypothetical protein
MPNASIANIYARLFAVLLLDESRDVQPPGDWQGKASDCGKSNDRVY